MKLKILLMPVSVIISVVLIIWHIYPVWFGNEIDSIKSTRSDIKKIKSEIADANTKKDNVQKLSQSLSSNEELEQLVNKFYPTYRNDEDVVNSINSIAFSNGVFLLNMGIEYKNIQETDDSVKVMAIPFEKPIAPISTDSILSTGDANQSLDMKESAEDAVKKAKANIKFIEASLEALGNYDQLKKFMVSLNDAGLINNIQSFKIYKKKNPSNEVEKENSASPDVLNADIVIGFGYLVSSDKEIPLLLSKDLFSRSEFNFSDIENKKDILTGNYKRSEIGETGATNPFLKEANATEEKSAE